MRWITGFILFVLMTVFSIHSASAHTQEASEKRVLWGLKTSMDVELPGKWKGNNGSVEMFRPGVGFTIGGVSNIYLGKNFYLEPGLSIFYSQYKYKDLIVLGEENHQESDPKLYKWGVQIPLVVGYTIGFTDNFAMNVFTGPEVRYAFAGKIVLKNKDLPEGSYSPFNDLWNLNGQRRVDCAWKIGIGVPVGNFDISLEADLGMTDLLKGPMKFRENRMGLGVTCYF